MAINLLDSTKSILLKKPKMSSIMLTFGVSLFLLIFGNYSFWAALSDILFTSYKHYMLFLISVFIVILLYINLLLTLVSFKYIQKPLLIVLLITSSFVSYFMDSYGIVIDHNMIGNIGGTDAHEAFELIHIKLIMSVLLLGILPSIFVYRVEIQYTTIKRDLFQKTGVISVSLVLLLSVIYPFYQEYASLARNNRHLRHKINPVNYINALRHRLNSFIKEGDIVMKSMGLDAAQSKKEMGKRTITILVVGETARAKNFSLLGYKKNTNPLLAGLDIITYSKVSSCGTTTAVSLPCIFSHNSRKEFSTSDVKRYEGLLDVVTRAGVKVLFRDNNTGCKGVCARVKTENMMSMNVLPYCKSGECFDEILLYKLQKYIDITPGDLLIVLHQNGSHGPAYYQRYPQRFKKFTPLCATNQLQNCSKKNIVNTYDNTIVYTDYFLSKVIALLKTNSKTSNSAMIYVSDHGESLGDKGVFLHGLPYIIAPDEQTHVPMIVWLSNSYKTSFGVNYQCLRSQSNQKLSHDNVFHTVLGLTAVTTHLYNKNLDILSTCKKVLSISEN